MPDPKIRISNLQLLTVLANLVFGKAIGYTGEVLTRAVSHDAWVAMVLAFAEGGVVMVCMVWLARRFPAERPTEYLPRLLGRWGGALVMFTLALWFLGSFITSSITISQHINDYLMTETPFVVFVIGYTLICMFGAHLGLEVTGRLSLLGLISIAGLNFLMVIGSIDHFRVDRLLPLFDHGVGNVGLASLLAVPDVAMATAGALFLLPLTKSPGKWMKVSLWGLAIGGVLTAIWTVFEVGVLGAEVTAQYLIACMQMARAAELGIYLHRYELIMVIFFVYSVFTQSIICLYVSAEMTSAALPLKRLKRPWLILILGIASMVIHYYLANNRDTYALFLLHVWPQISVPVAWGLPLLLCLVALVRPKLKAAGKAVPVGESRGS